MEWFEALILGLIQGLTEYLPVSSSGHLAIGSALFGIEGEENLAFTIVVHVATVFSTLVILWKEIDWIFKGLFKWQMNEETRYVINILVSGTSFLVAPITALSPEKPAIPVPTTRCAFSSKVMAPIT